MEDDVELGARVEPFVDGWLLERHQQVVLRLTPPQKREVVLRADKPWEGNHAGYYSVGHSDEGQVRLYYRGYSPDDDSKEQVCCLAQSDDGVVFRRSALGLYPFGGASEPNNITFRGVEAHNFAPFRDTNPNARPNERYKALGGRLPQGLRAFGSSDGVRWHLLHPEPVVRQGAFDSLNVAFWDEHRGTYRCYLRFWRDGQRAIQSAVSSDFLSWSEPQPNCYDGGFHDELYTNATCPCPGAPHILLSFPMRFVEERRKIETHPTPGVSDALLMSSRDGVNWHKFAEPWLRPGLEPDNWSDRSIMPAWGIVPTRDGETGAEEFSLYVSEGYRTPNNRLRRVTVPRHRFASLYAPRSGAEAVTRVLRFAGRRLVLNCATSAVGEVRVEVQDAAGRALPDFTLEECEPLFGNELDAPVRWRNGGDVSSLCGQAVRLRFFLRDADLYALQVRDT